MVENKSIISRIRVAVIYVVVVCMGLLCLLPLWNMVCISFSSAGAVSAQRVSFLPVDFTLQAYSKIVEDTQFWRSFGISVLRVVLALALNLTLLLLTAYPMSMPEGEFKGRKFFMGLFLVNMLFSGGLIPFYIQMKNMRLLNTIWVLVLPGAMSVGNMIMVMNFFRGIPQSLGEAASMDGASPLQILWHVYVPCAKASIATMALFSIVGSWNNFFDGLVYITQIKNYPLMTYIHTLQVNLQELAQNGSLDASQLSELVKVSGLNLNAAKIVVAVIPLLAIYPFLQRYLITGIVMGSVKE